MTALLPNCRLSSKNLTALLTLLGKGGCSTFVVRRLFRTLKLRMVVVQFCPCTVHVCFNTPVTYPNYFFGRTNRSKSPVDGKEKQVKKLRGFATSTPAVKDIKPFGARLGKKVSPKKRKRLASSSDEESGLSNIEVSSLVQ